MQDKSRRGKKKKKNKRVEEKVQLLVYQECNRASMSGLNGRKESTDSDLIRSFPLVLSQESTNDFSGRFVPKPGQKDDNDDDSEAVTVATFVLTHPFGCELCELYVSLCVCGCVDVDVCVRVCVLDATKIRRNGERTKRDQSSDLSTCFPIHG